MEKKNLEGILLLNTDASYIPERGEGAMGGVKRDANDAFVVAVSVIETIHNFHSSHVICRKYLTQCIEYSHNKYCLFPLVSIFEIHLLTVSSSRVAHLLFFLNKHEKSR